MGPAVCRMESFDVRRWLLFSMVIAGPLLGGCKSGPRDWFQSMGRERTVVPAGAEPRAGSLTKGDRTAANSGILAGQVLDAFNQRCPNAAIEVIKIDGNSESSVKQAIADSQGYFVIQGLEAGKRYKLVAKAKQGEPALRGTTLVTAPYARVLIKLNEDLDPNEVGKDARAGANPTGGGEWRPPVKTGQPEYLHEPDRGYAGAAPGDRIAPQPIGGGSPFPTQSNDPQRQTPTPPRRDLVTQDQGDGRTLPPRASIPGPGTMGGASPFGHRGQLSPTLISEIPLTTLAGEKVNLSSFKGKLLLLEFWGTWCPACNESLPLMAKFHQQYADRGLAVVGVAYEDGPLAEKAARVQFVANRQGVNYPLVLGNGDHCPLLKHLDVQRFPTVILLDGDGNLLWRSESLSSENHSRLRAELARRLGD